MGEVAGRVLPATLPATLKPHSESYLCKVAGKSGKY
jgi:hypothetical protein